jgi:hypothetical protein
MRLRGRRELHRLTGQPAAQRSIAAAAIAKGERNDFI